MMQHNKYGQCDICGHDLVVEEWFKEYEYEPKSNIPTGRVRRAASCLVCPNCLKHYPIDDTFDGNWYYERRY